MSGHLQILCYICYICYICYRGHLQILFEELGLLLQLRPNASEAALGNFERGRNALIGALHQVCERLDRLRERRTLTLLLRHTLPCEFGIGIEPPVRDLSQARADPLVELLLRPRGASEWSSKPEGSLWGRAPWVRGAELAGAAQAPANAMGKGQATPATAAPNLRAAQVREIPLPSAAKGAHRPRTAPQQHENVSLTRLEREREIISGSRDIIMMMGIR